jgi:hypothetical protein
LKAFLITTMRATLPAHLTLLSLLDSFSFYLYLSSTQAPITGCNSKESEQSNCNTGNINQTVHMPFLHGLVVVFGLWDESRGGPNQSSDYAKHMHCAMYYLKCFVTQPSICKMNIVMHIWTWMRHVTIVF